MASFLQVMRPTDFGFYDADPIFQFDADRMVTFVLRQLGEDVLGVELTKKMIWSSFEVATRQFESQIIEYQATSNLASLLGMPTGSLNTTNGLSPSNINLTNMYVRNNLEFLDRMSEAYSAMIGLGGLQDTFSGSITLVVGRQDYNLYTELVDESGTPIYELIPTGSRGKIQIYEVFHMAPVQYVFNGAITNNFVGVGAAAGSSITDARFHVLPVFEDVLRASMIKTAQRVRRSHYSYKITGKHIRIFPTPTFLIPDQNKIWVRCGFKQGPLPTMAETLAISGTTYNPANPKFTMADDSIYGASNPANVPFGLIDYKSLNPWARNWIAQYTLALCKEQLGYVRTKYDSIPVADKDLKLNGDLLLTHGREDAEKLLTALKEKLESLAYDKLAEREANKAEMMVKQLAYVPIPPTWVIKYG